MLATGVLFLDPGCLLFRQNRGPDSDPDHDPDLDPDSSRRLPAPRHAGASRKGVGDEGAGGEAVGGEGVGGEGVGVFRCRRPNRWMYQWMDRLRLAAAVAYLLVQVSLYCTTVLRITILL